MAQDKNSSPDRQGEGPGTIRVTDRRMFTRDGERRGEAEPPAEEASGATGGDQPGEEQRGRSEAPATPGSIDFIAFVQSLYVSALMSLGEVENPYTHQLETNLDLARQNIDILAMLLEKTHGNLSGEEQGFIDQVVPHLQMLFVKKAG